MLYIALSVLLVGVAIFLWQQNNSIPENKDEKTFVMIPHLWVSQALREKKRIAQTTYRLLFFDEPLSTTQRIAPIKRATFGFKLKKGNGYLFNSRNTCRWS